MQSHMAILIAYCIGMKKTIKHCWVLQFLLENGKNALFWHKVAWEKNFMVGPGGGGIALCPPPLKYATAKRRYYYYYFYYSIATASTAIKYPRHTFYRSRVIAHVVPNFVLPWQRGSVGVKFGLQHSTAQSRKPLIAANISQISMTEAEL